MYHILYLLTISLFLNGCGTKGSLYIPEEKYPQAILQENFLLERFSART